MKTKKNLFPKLQSKIDALNFDTISPTRKKELQPLINYVAEHHDKTAQINFICTHNSRRSQFGQVWAQVAADYYDVKAACFSSGTEVTACNERTIASLIRFGFEIEKEGIENPLYKLKYGFEPTLISVFSKRFDHPKNPKTNFAAVMTCAHADENCPYIPGAELRIPIRYMDPKLFDDSLEEEARYDERSLQIATEMFYVFSNI
ncbi:protein-tyrosine-phosphatase [Echinicola sp. CAU 1574]|uniref:Protein-tyrosine-phosphatase n=1 Tax=Echinicola arenosa TaxID=2774144 RepID=A0ABR9AQL4_9BACT|nr:protein-tyrosine-phosphatase [Echinicola arenosa]MBD8490656.1 protein-tyrosine-phosphatase [Echinicola arenosa]